MEKKYRSPLEVYLGSIFKFIMIAIPVIAICAGATFTALKLAGFYEDVSIVALIIFDLTCVIYLLIGLGIARNCEDNERNIKQKYIKIGKIFFLFLYVIQWNFISYMIPSRGFWAYSLFFILLAVSLMDHKFLLGIIIEIVVSTIISWIILPDKLLPVKDEFYTAEIILRIVLIFFGCISIWSLQYMTEKYLVGELEKMADFDTLTLLYNRRKLQMFMDKAIEHKKKEDKDFSLIMIDLDDFKIINDTYGHSCGDEVLKDIANIIRNIVGNDGVVFRYGGEEMLALLYMQEENTYQIAEIIRKQVETHKTFYEDVTINVTITLGMATYTNKDNSEKLIKRADNNLYYGKTHGKNCVVK